MKRRVVLCPTHLRDKLLDDGLEFQLIEVFEENDLIVRLLLVPITFGGEVLDHSKFDLVDGLSGLQIRQLMPYLVRLIRELLVDQRQKRLDLYGRAFVVNVKRGRKNHWFEKPEKVRLLVALDGRLANLFGQLDKFWQLKLAFLRVEGMMKYLKTFVDYKKRINELKMFLFSPISEDQVFFLQPAVLAYLYTCLEKSMMEGVFYRLQQKGFLDGKIIEQIYAGEVKPLSMPRIEHGLASQFGDLSVRKMIKVKRPSDSVAFDIYSDQFKK